MPDLQSRCESLWRAGAQLEVMELLLAAYAANPSDRELRAQLQHYHAKRPKLAVFCPYDQATFLGAIYQQLEQRFQTRYVTVLDDSSIRSELSWADVAFFEWCREPLASASRMETACKLIGRLHRWEAYTPLPRQVDWAKVDALITIGNPFVVEQLQREVYRLSANTELVSIPNGVDLTRFAFRERSRGKNIAFIGRLVFAKNPILLLMCMHTLLQRDPDYRLFVAGEYREHNSDDRSLRHYIDTLIDELRLGDAIRFEGYIDDIPAWLSDKHYVVSTSMVEGLPVNLLEAMACGLRPLIHCWPGSRDIFAHELIFRTPDEFCQMVLEADYQPQRYRAIVESQFSEGRQLEQITALVERVARARTGETKTERGAIL
jgi:glycosyltransferase involved in cell wall biosynthesis